MRLGAGRSWLIGLVALAAMLCVGLGAFLVLTLMQVNNDLRTRADALSGVHADLTRIKHDLAVTDREASELGQSVEELQGENAGLSADLAESLLNAKQLQATLDEATTKASASEAQVRELTNERSQLQDKVQDLEQQIEKANYDYATLQAMAGKVEEVRTELLHLGEEVVRWREEYGPFIPDIGHGITSLCTGSMEPAITCLDTTTVLRNPMPENIVVGAVISFFAPACSPRAAGHRVIDRKKVGDVWLFRTKGDNNDGDDGCWIKGGEVSSYVIELHKNTEPQWAPIRDFVNEAKADYAEAKETWQGLREANGCHRTEGQCTFSASAGQQKYQNAVKAYDELIRYKDAYWCAVDYARNPGNYETSRTVSGEVLVKPLPTCLEPPKPLPGGQEWGLQ